VSNLTEDWFSLSYFFISAYTLVFITSDNLKLNS